METHVAILLDVFLKVPTNTRCQYVPHAAYMRMRPKKRALSVTPTAPLASRILNTCDILST
jgi:hypothetical protein